MKNKVITPYWGVTAILSFIYYTYNMPKMPFLPRTEKGRFAVLFPETDTAFLTYSECSHYIVLHGSKTKLLGGNYEEGF